MLADVSVLPGMRAAQSAQALIMSFGPHSRICFEIEWLRGERLSITGYRTGIAGLLAARVRYTDGTIRHHHWQLWHESSGLGLGDCSDLPTLKDVGYLALLIAKLVDWRQNREQLVKTLLYQPSIGVFIEGHRRTILCRRIHGHRK